MSETSLSTQSPQGELRPIRDVTKHGAAQEQPRKIELRGRRRNKTV